MHLISKSFVPEFQILSFSNHQRQSGKIFETFYLKNLIPILHCSNLCSIDEKHWAHPSEKCRDPRKKLLNQKFNILGISIKVINDIFSYS